LQELKHGKRWVIAAVAAAIVVAAGATLFELDPSAAPSPVSSGPRSLTRSLTSTYVNGSSGLSLRLTINTTVLTRGQNLSVSISEYNSANTLQNVSVAAHWPISNLTLYPCGRIGYPFGVAVLRGNYEEGNLSLGTTLQIVESGSQSCPSTPGFNNYYFEIHSDKAALSGDCTPSVSCGQPYNASQTIAITGYWTGGAPIPMEPLTPSVLHPLQHGEYTLVAGDEWGNEAILHFVVKD